MAGRIVASVEPLYLVAIAPFLLFPTFRPALTAVALAGLALLWLGRAVARRETWPVTPFSAALLVFCLAIPLAVWASPLPELTLPKLTGVILGLAAFRAVTFAVRTRRDLLVALAAVAAIGLVVWTLGLFGMRLAPLQPLTQRLPPSLVSLPGAEQGINPNQLSGALMLLLPLLLACAAGCWQAGRRALSAALLLVALLALVTLALTQSRAGWIGFAAAATALSLALVWFKTGARGRKALVAGLVAATVVVFALALVAGPALVSQSDASGAIAAPGDATLTLAARAEIWSRALYALQDFPFTGVGLGAFRRVVNVLYPLFLVPPDADIAHSHNIFLQVGVDLGLIGLVGYTALLLVAVVTAWQVASGTRGFERYVALGALAALAGLHVYGLADALALGSKPSVLLWLVLGLVAAVGEMRGARVAADVKSGAGEGPAATQALLPPG